MRRETKDNILMSIVVIAFFLNMLLLNIPFLNAVPVMEELLAVGWLLLGIGALLVLFSVLALRRKGTSDVTYSGVYGVVRHPMYLGGMLMFLSHVFFGQNWITAIGTVVGVVCSCLLIQSGDQRNIEKFGDDYKRYTQKVPRMNIIVGIIRLLRGSAHPKKEYHKEQSKAAFDKVAFAYNASSDYRFAKHARKAYPHMLDRLQKISFDSLLDVGMGTGAILATILEKKNFKAAGLDISPQMIKAADKKLKGTAGSKVGDSEELPWKGNSFDSLVCDHSFQHFPNPQIVVGEMMRVLEPSGYLLFSDVRHSFVVHSIHDFSLRFGNPDVM